MTRNYTITLEELNQENIYSCLTPEHVDIINTYIITHIQDSIFMSSWAFGVCAIIFMIGFIKNDKWIMVGSGFILPVCFCIVFLVLGWFY